MNIPQQRQPCPTCGQTTLEVVLSTDGGDDRIIAAMRRELKRQLAPILAELGIIHTDEEHIMTEQDNIDAATTEINTEVADLGAKDVAIEDAQAKLLAAIQAIPTGVDTTALVSATAALLTAQGADDATVAALTAAANPAPVDGGDTPPVDGTPVGGGTDAPAAE